jgi:hypothetical protein
MGYHFVVDEFVFFGQHHVAVQREEAPKLVGFKDVYALEIAMPAENLVVYTNGKFYVFGVGFGEP